MNSINLATLMLTLLRNQGGGSSVAYSVKDEFLTDASAPLTTPRTSEPTGTVTLVTPEVMSIANEKLVMTDAPSRDAIIHSGTRARGDGVVLVVRGGQATGTTHNVEVGVLNTSNTRLFYISPRSGGGFITTNTDSNYLNAYDSGFLDSLAETTYALMLHADGGVSAFQLISDTWTHLWREYTNTDANVRLAAWAWTLAGGSSTVVFDFFRVAQLPAPFNGEWATDYAASPSGSYTGAANQTLDITLTAPGTISAEAGLKYRQQDANNYWRVYFDTSGALRVDSVEAGVATNRASVAGMITGGAVRRVRVIMYGSTQRIFTETAGVWTQRASVTGNSTFSTQTGITTDIGAGWTAADLRAYERTSSQYAMLDNV